MENYTLHFLETNSTSNHTTDYYDREDFKKAASVLLTLLIIISVTAIGADISWNQIYKGIRHPVGPAIGIFSQFVIMPLIGFIYNVIFQFESSVAAGLLIMSCSPGGAVSNTFTYYLDGDVSLSVTMTTVSIIVSLGLMPLNIWIYSSEAKNLIIPYGNIALSLIKVVSPVLLGMILKWKFPKASTYITKWGNAMAMILLLITTLLYILSYQHMFDILSWRVIVTSIFSPTTGLLLGYVIAILSRRSKPICTAISVECGIQNVAVAYSVIDLSFDISRNTSIMLIPIFFGISQIIICSILCIIYNFIKNILNKRQSQDNYDDSKEDKVERSGIFSSEDSSENTVIAM